MRSRLILALYLTAAALSFTIWAADNEKPWVVALSLDSADLATPAVQWAIFYDDPVPQFKERVKRNRNLNLKMLKNSGDERRMKATRSAQITADWDRAFRKVTGDKVYMLTGGAGESQGYSSDDGGGDKWIVTKTVSVHGTPVCWCLHVEVHQGENPQLRLTEKNRFDLLNTYENIMNEPASEK